MSGLDRVRLQLDQVRGAVNAIDPVPRHAGVGVHATRPTGDADTRPQTVRLRAGFAHYIYPRYTGLPTAARDR